MNQKMRKIVLSVGLCIVLLIPLAISTTLNIEWVSERATIEDNQFVQEFDSEVSETGCFIENAGQIGNDEILFYSSIPGGSIGFTDSRILLWSLQSEDFVELSFPGGNAVTPSGITPVDEYFNFIMGHHGTFTHLRGYESVVFEELWSGIDLVYKYTSEGAKYEFRVFPGANPTNIKIRCDGHDDLVIDDIDITIAKDEIVFRDVGLLVSQTHDKTVQASYLRYDHQTYGVAVGDYDQTDTLIVDPLIFSTYLGGVNVDATYTTTVDNQNNIIVGGWSYSNDFPLVGAYNITHGGGMDCMIAKFDSSGDLLYSTFIGGSGTDYVTGLDVDPDDGQIIVVGLSESSEFPTTTGVLNETINGGADIVVLRLTATGDDLVFSTFVGGSETELAYSMTTLELSAVGRWIYVTGYTESPDFPVVQFVTPGWNGSYVGGQDIIVFVLSPDGTYLAWSNIVGGTGDDKGTDIGLDDYYWPYVTGYTESDDLPTDEATFDPYDADYNGNRDCFCLGFSRFGDELGVLTYLGGADDDRAYGIAVTGIGASYITGITFSDDFPTPNAYDDSYNSQGDVFVAKLTPDGSELAFATYVGGFYEERGNSILIGEGETLIVAGRTGSTDFPTRYAYDDSYNGGVDGFILKMSTDGKTLFSSTYFGGSEDEYISHGIANDTNGNLIVTGGTYSTKFPTGGSSTFDDSHNGEQDAFVMVFTSDFAYPEFESVVRDISSPNSRQTVQITAQVTDLEGVAHVTLQYRTDTTWEDVPMVELVGGSNNWTADIPTVTIDTNVEYRVLANDSAGNLKVSTSDSYVVVAPPPLVIETGMIIALVTLAAAILGIIGGVIKLRAAQIDKGIGIGSKDT